MNEPFIIMSAPNGARRQKSDHPALPITPDDMASCAEQILSEGASILHLHVRDNTDGHSLDVDHYRASITAIRDAVGNNLIIQATSESVGIYTRHQQMDMVKTLKPEATSLALRELCPAEDDLLEFSLFTKWIKDEHIFPQYILYNQADFDRFETYRKQGVFHEENPFVLFVLGSYSEADEAATKQLKQTTLRASTPWAVCGFDTNEKNSVIHAAQNHGHIRVGFENNLWRDENELLKDNGEMIRFSAKIADQENRPVATAADVRNIFDLKG